MRRFPSARALLPAGFFLLVLGVYFLSGPGRIDIVDGQIRYDVTRNWWVHGSPEIRDPIVAGYGVRGVDGRLYSLYNAGASVVALPVVALSLRFGDAKEEIARFLFSSVSALFGAGTVAILVLWVIDLGVSRRRAVWAGLVVAFASYLWPLSATTFDQAQHAFFLTASLYLGWRAGQRESIPLAFVSGALFAALVNYQENFLLLWPGVALLVAPAGGLRDRRVALRLAANVLPILVGVAGIFAFNKMRFGLAYFVDRTPIGVRHPPYLGNPLVGLPSLLLSPGKSVLLYSPTLLLGLCGIRRLRGAHPRLATSIVVVSATQLLFVSCLSFFGSDWAWGPRYLGPVVGLWILPAATGLTWNRRTASRVVVFSGVVVQMLGLSIDHHRFFLEHRLHGFFWADDSTFYYRHSALLHRPVEIVRATREARACTGCPFSYVPYEGLTTYLALGNRDRDAAPEWIRSWGVYHLPRPWPLWMSALGRGRAPFAPTTPASIAGAVLVLGGVLIAASIREGRPLRGDILR